MKYYCNGKKGKIPMPEKITKRKAKKELKCIRCQEDIGKGEIYYCGKEKMYENESVAIVKEGNWCADCADDVFTD